MMQPRHVFLSQPAGKLLLSAMLCALNFASYAANSDVDWQTLQPNNTNVSLIVADPSGKRLIDHNSRQLQLPASTLKLFTAVAATKVLGPDFVFSTGLYYQGKREGSKLNGNLLLKFDGDPRLTSEQLGRLLAEVPKAGITEVSGDVILLADDDSPKWGAGWLWDDLGVCFAAPVGKLILDKNCVKGSVTSIQPKVKEATNVNAQSYPSRVHLSYPLTIENSASYQPTAPSALCKLHLGHAQGNQYQLTGCYQMKDPLPLQVAIVDPAAYIQAQIRQLIGNTFQLAGDVKVAPASIEHATLISQFPSMPLQLLLTEMLVKSDNLIADAVLKRMGQKLFQHNGFEYGAQALKQTLSGLGVDMTDANIMDGSGLSRYNQVSAEQLFSLLLLLQRDDQLKWLIKALPLSGYNGTLKFKRGFVNPQLRGKIRAKTGSMTGVDNLAGYIQIGEDDTAKLYPFVLLETGLPANQYHPATLAPPLLKQLIKQFTKPSAIAAAATSKAKNQPKLAQPSSAANQSQQ